MEYRVAIIESLEYRLPTITADTPEEAEAKARDMFWNAGEGTVSRWFHGTADRTATVTPITGTTP